MWPQGNSFLIRYQPIWKIVICKMGTSCITENFTMFILGIFFNINVLPFHHANFYCIFRSTIWKFSFDLTYKSTKWRRPCFLSHHVIVVTKLAICHIDFPEGNEINWHLTPRNHSSECERHVTSLCCQSRKWLI